MTERDKMFAAFLAGSRRPTLSTAHSEKSFAQWYTQFQNATKPSVKNPEPRIFCNSPKIKSSGK